MNKRQITTIKKHKTLAIGISIVLGALWLMLVMYTLSADRAAKTEINPGTIAASSVKQHADENKTATPTVKAPRAAASSLVQHHDVPPIVDDDAPQATMHSTSMHIRQTSDATVHSAGSGIARATYAATTPRGTNQRGISYSGLGFGGNMFLMSSSLALATPGATHANDLTEVGSPQERNGMKKTEGPPSGPMPDPIGDITWGLMAVLGMIWCIRIYRKKRLRKQSV